MGRYRTMKDVTPPRFVNHGSTRSRAGTPDPALPYAARFVEEPFEDGALVIQFEYRFGQNCYDAVVMVREDREGEQFHRETLLCRIDNVLPAGVTRERMAEAAHDIANAEA